MQPSVALMRSTASELWSHKEWRKWCQPKANPTGKQKPDLPLLRRRLHDTAIVRDWVAKRPVASTVTARSQKRNVFTRKRIGHLVSQGVKRTITKTH